MFFKNIICSDPITTSHSFSMTSKTFIPKVKKNDMHMNKNYVEKYRLRTRIFFMRFLTFECFLNAVCVCGKN